MPKKIGKYELGKTLGEGNFSKVKYGVDTEDKARTAYAIKQIDRQKMKEQNMEEQLKCEIAILKLLHMEYIVTLREVLVTQKHIYMVLELVTGGELFDRIVTAKKFDEPTGRRHFQQIALALYYCHSKGVAHRDLKPENLLLDANNNIKITDFGLSAMQSAGENRLLSTTCGTPHYVAPEIISEKPYNGFIADVWSCGVILFVMLAGYLPFEDSQMNGLFNKIERGEYRVPRHFSEEVVDLLSKLLTTDPGKRITLNPSAAPSSGILVLEHTWVTVDLDTDIYLRLQGLQSTDAEKQAMADAKEGKGSAFEEVEEETYAGMNKSTAQMKLNGFELTSRLMMGGLTPFASGGGQQTAIRRGTRFMANGEPDELCKALADFFQSVGLPATRKEGSLEVKGIGNTATGPRIISAVVFPTVSPTLCMVEVRRLRGDVIEFQKFYKQLVRGLGEKLVPALLTDERFKGD